LIHLKQKMNSAIQKCPVKASWLSPVLIFISAMMFFGARAQSPSEYHFVYVNINKINELSLLQSRLEQLYFRIQSEKYVMFLSNRDEPIVATSQPEYEKMMRAISNLTVNIPSLDNDIVLINKVMNEHEFVTLSKGENSLGNPGFAYDKIFMHFFADPMNFKNLDMEKNLIDKICAINFLDKSDPILSILVYFETNALKAAGYSGTDIFKAKELILIKY